MYIDVFIKKYYNLILYIQKISPVYAYTKFTDILQNTFFGTMAKYYDLDIYNLNGQPKTIKKMLEATGKNTHIITPYPSIHVFYNKE